MCDESSDECIECLTNGDCDDGLFCNGAEACVSGTCQDGAEPCTAGQTCDDVTNSCESNVSLNVNLIGDRTSIVPPGAGTNDRVVLTVTVTNPSTRNLTDVVLHIEFGADMQAVSKTGAGVFGREGGVPVGFTWAGAELSSGGTVLQHLTARLSPDLSDQEITQLVAADVMLTATARFQGANVGSTLLRLDIAPGTAGDSPGTEEEPPVPADDDDTCGCNGTTSPMAGMILLGLFFMKRGMGRRRSRQ